jgi:hypothetical protein
MRADPIRTPEVEPLVSAHALRVAGAVLVAGAVGFIVVFAVLSASFGYPDVLDRPASEVLPRLLAGGARLRAIWGIYAVLPVAITVVALLAHDRLGLTRPVARLVTAAGVVAGVAMAVGLLRWSTIQWGLAEAHRSISDDPGARAALEGVSTSLNLMLGRVLGEFVGEVCLATWFLGVGLGLRARWMGRACVALAALLFVGSVRAVIAPAGAATEITNFLLPAVMLWLGLTWVFAGVSLHRRRLGAPIEAP